MTYKRKTIDEYEIQGLYFGEQECVTVEETFKDAKEMVKCYRENEVGTPFRIKKKRIPIEEVLI